jgi:glycosidase
MSRDVFTPRNLMTVGEMSSTSLEHCQQYAAQDGRELSMTFNFHHLKVDYPGGEKWTLAPGLRGAESAVQPLAAGHAQPGVECAVLV